MKDEVGSDELLRGNEMHGSAEFSKNAEEFQVVWRLYCHQNIQILGKSRFSIEANGNSTND